MDKWPLLSIWRLKLENLHFLMTGVLHFKDDAREFAARFDSLREEVDLAHDLFLPRRDLFLTNREGDYLGRLLIKDRHVYFRPHPSWEFGVGVPLPPMKGGMKAIADYLETIARLEQ